jgi:hypothetical protein
VPPFPLSIESVTLPDQKTEAGLGDDIIIKVKNLSEENSRRRDPANAATEKEIDPRKLVLFLDGIEITKLNPRSVVPETGELRFTLERDKDSRQAWNNFLAQPTADWHKNVTASVGEEGKFPFESKQSFSLRLYYPSLLNVGVGLFVVFLIGFLVAAWRTPIIRDSTPVAPVGGPLTRPFSLARLQAAWWFFIVLGSFLFIALVTWDYDTLTTSALALLGIGSATALGASVVDSNKRESTNSDLRTLKPQEAKLTAAVEELKTRGSEAEARIGRGEAASSTLLAIRQDQASVAKLNTDLAAKEAELEQVKVQVNDAAAGLEKPVSEGFLNDVLSDVNGVTLHRFQMLVWTVVLGLIFVYEVWSKLTMPDFSETLLALMGLSAATYIGFKIPEKQTNPEDAASGNDPTGGGNVNGGEDAAARAAAAREEEVARTVAAQEEAVRAAAAEAAEAAAREVAAQEEAAAKKENVAAGQEGVG